MAHQHCVDMWPVVEDGDIARCRVRAVTIDGDVLYPIPFCAFASSLRLGVLKTG